MPDPLPPAPASDETLAAAPEFIVGDTWDDAEWRAVAAKPASALTESEKYLWAGGPRPHPWGRTVFYMTRQDGVRVAFPSKDAHDKHMAEATKKQADGDSNAANALNALNAGLAAQATASQQPVAPASDPTQAGFMLEAAAPHGSVVG